MKDLLRVLQDEPYHIRVFHSRVRDENGVPSARGGSTTVVLQSHKHGPEVAAATAYCSEKDNFCRRTGRNVAIGRALKKLGVNPVYE